MKKLKLLDLYCGAGGAGIGYHRAGFDVTGVDIEFQKNYPCKFHQYDALKFLRKYGGDFDVIHASPPCQQYTCLRSLHNREYPDLVDPTRAEMPSDRPWIIENVPGSPLNNPITLCGLTFGLGVYRHRLFESNRPLTAPQHLWHTVPIADLGKPPKEGEMMYVVGHFSTMAAACKAMGIYWMTCDELREAIPPAYTEYLGKQIVSTP